MILTGYILIYLYLLFSLLIAFILNKLKIRTIIIRKLIHIFLSLAWIISYYYFGSTIHLIIPPISFVVINFVAYKYNIFKWAGKKPRGIIYYPLSFLILGMITYFHPSFYYAFGIGFFCMALADGLAPLVAGYLKSRELINRKTLVGSITVLVISLIIVFVFNIYFDLEFNFIKIFMISIVAALLELIGKDGLDNLYVPLGVAAFVYLLGVI